MTEPDYQQPDLSLTGDDHIRRYRQTNGEVGYLWNGVPTLLLTTSGRKTGQHRTSALIFGRDVDDYLVVASVGGSPHHPGWYLNLLANPAAQIQVRDRHLTVTARTASDDEKRRLWTIMTDIWPNYDVYQRRTARVIPIVALTTTA